LSTHLEHFYVASAARDRATDKLSRRGSKFSGLTIPGLARTASLAGSSCGSTHLVVVSERCAVEPLAVSFRRTSFCRCPLAEERRIERLLASQLSQRDASG